MREVLCPVCKKCFVTTNSQKVYCSEDCHNISRNTERKKVKAVPEIRASNGPIIDAYSREANLRHISYGQLQTERYLKKMREASNNA